MTLICVGVFLNKVLIMEHVDRETPLLNRDNQYWRLWGNRRIPKPELVYVSQIVILYIIIICSLANLTLDKGERALWISLLSLSIGVSSLSA
jgi:uncharacterized membrane protein YdfJ with MMPL/SSD domain